MSAYSDWVVANYSPSVYWAMDDVTGVTDQTANGNDGTGAGGISIGGDSSTGSPILGESVVTDFAGGYVTSSYNPFVNATTRTWFGWVYRDVSTANHTIMGSSSTNGSECLFLTGGNSWYWDSNRGTAGGGNTITNVSPGNGQWFLIAWVFNESTDALEVFVNGTSAGTASHTQQYQGSPGTYQLGVVGTSTNPFNGKMCHFGVVEGALTGTDLTAIRDIAINGVPAAANDPAPRTFVHTAGRGQ